MSTSRFALLQARNAGDPASQDEHRAFAARLGVPSERITIVDVLEEMNEMLERGVITADQFETLMARARDELTQPKAAAPAAAPPRFARRRPRWSPWRDRSRCRWKSWRPTPPACS